VCQPDADSNAYGDTYANTNTNSYGDGDTHTDGNADSYSYGHSYVYCNGNSHSHSDGHADTNSASCVANPNYSAQNYADAQAAADESSAGRALSGTLKGGNSRETPRESPPEMEGSARVPQRMVWEAPEKLSG
jgi:hypothetical protein